MAYIWLICLWRISLTISHLGRISLLYPTLGGYPCCIPPGADIPAASHLGRISLTVSHLWRISVNVSHLWRISLTVSHLRRISLTVSWRKPIGARIGISTQMITYNSTIRAPVGLVMACVQYCTVCTREFVHLICKNKMRFSTFQKNALKQKLKELKRL